MFLYGVTFKINSVPIFQTIAQTKTAPVKTVNPQYVFSQEDICDKFYLSQEDYSEAIESDMRSVQEFSIFTEKERKKFSKKVAQCYGDYESLIGVLHDKKPAVVFDYRFDYLPKIKRDNIEVVLSDESSFVLNKKMLKETIRKNKFLYTHSFKMSRFSTVNMIYSRLIQGMKEDNLDSDVLGVSLGFPLLDSMIFMLDRQTGYQGRADSLKFKKRLLNYLNQDDSIYKNLPQRELSQLKQAIERISQVEFYDDGITSYVKYI